METREVKNILVKRQHIQLATFDSGHWWFEIGEWTEMGWESSESYGWYPSEKSSGFLSRISSTLLGVAGALNGHAAHGGSANDASGWTDACHGDEVEEMFHPLVSVADTRPDFEIANCLRVFARNYKGIWQWRLGWGQNCHTFQGEALRHCDLLVPESARKFTL